MRMASIFKEFVTTYNRTYESKEGEDPDLAVSVPIRSGPSPPLGTLVLERGRPLLSSDFLGQHGSSSFWIEWDGAKARFSLLVPPPP